MKKRELLEAIQDYLAGTLPVERKVPLEQLIAEDPAAAALFNDCRLAYLAIRAAREERLRKDMKKWDEEKQE